MGEEQGTLFSLDFNRSVVIEARPERLSSDAGALLIRDLTDRLGLPELADTYLDDPRDPDRISHPFVKVLRTWLLLSPGAQSVPDGGASKCTTQERGGVKVAAPIGRCKGRSGASCRTATGLCGD
jgi:hypothetical protein